MNRFILRWAINAVGLYAAIALVPGIHPQSTNWLSIIWLALIFGIVNALLNPLLKLLTCPLILLTLGLFTLVINMALFMVAGYIGTAFGVGFTVDGWLTAFLGSLVVSAVSIVLSMVLRDELKK
ncbi:MAG: phage holin family protein [Anaerolineales bacterium]|nr:phage holin family protein [Anaerolineales bacterium]MDD5467310.1 phage holin family protein [Anaerolineales bacterium]